MNGIMTKTVISVVMVGTLMTFSLRADAQAKAESGKSEKTPAVTVKNQTTCPVMGGSINKSIYVDHDGKRIYMCCKGCEGALKKDPAKYVKKLEDEGVTLDVVPVKDKSKKQK